MAKRLGLDSHLDPGLTVRLLRWLPILLLRLRLRRRRLLRWVLLRRWLILRILLLRVLLLLLLLLLLLILLLLLRRRWWLVLLLALRLLLLSGLLRWRRRWCHACWLLAAALLRRLSRWRLVVAARLLRLRRQRLIVARLLQQLRDWEITVAAVATQLLYGGFVSLVVLLRRWLRRLARGRRLAPACRLARGRWGPSTIPRTSTLGLGPAFCHFSPPLLLPLPSPHAGSRRRSPLSPRRWRLLLLLRRRRLFHAGCVLLDRIDGVEGGEREVELVEVLPLPSVGIDAAVVAGSWGHVHGVAIEP
eukprot:COSAG01_NODE_8245_length_2858_cov_1.884378_3_plen_304_part_00